jgi:hypothetical protein
LLLKRVMKMMRQQKQMRTKMAGVVEAQECAVRGSEMYWVRLHQMQQRLSAVQSMRSEVLSGLLVSWND